MPGLVKNNLTEYLSLFPFTVAETTCLESHDTLESGSSAVRLVPELPSFARSVDLLLLPVPHVSPSTLDSLSLTLPGLQALCQCRF